MSKQPNSVVRCGLIAVIVLAAAAGFYALRTSNLPQKSPEQSSPNPLIDLKEAVSFDPALLKYQEIAQFDVPAREVAAVAVGPDDQIYVAGDRAVHIFTPDGERQQAFEIKGHPTCLAIGGRDHVEAGRIYVGTGQQIEVLDAQHQPIAVWNGPSDKTIFTSLAATADGVFAADAGERVVVRYNTEGQIVGRIGQRDPDRDMPGFIVPSPHFDLAVDSSGTLVAVNPGARRVEMYTPDGDLDSFWGEESPTVDGFFGCCNPCHLALLPDGRFVTSEKGIPRVKIYDSAGDFESVVAGSEQLGLPMAALGDARSKGVEHIYDVAADGRGRVLVLDPVGKCVRVFVAKAGGEEGIE